VKNKTHRAEIDTEYAIKAGVPRGRLPSRPIPTLFELREMRRIAGREDTRQRKK
jgi:hypothetical protein